MRSRVSVGKKRKLREKLRELSRFLVFMFCLAWRSAKLDGWVKERGVGLCIEWNFQDLTG